MKTVITLDNGKTIDIADEMFELTRIRDECENYYSLVATQRIRAVGDSLSTKGGPDAAGLVLLNMINSQDFPEEFSSRLAMLWDIE